VWPELLAWLRSLARLANNILQYTQEWNLRKLRGQPSQGRREAAFGSKPW
jgi:hypothetical protein